MENRCRVFLERCVNVIGRDACALARLTKERKMIEDALSIIFVETPGHVLRTVRRRSKLKNKILCLILICKLRSRGRVSSYRACVKNISAEVSIFCLWTNWIHLVAGYNSVTNIITVAARWTKCVKFILSIAVHTGGLAKNHFQKSKKRIGAQLNYFWNMCPKPFSWAKKIK